MVDLCKTKNSIWTILLHDKDRRHGCLKDILCGFLMDSKTVADSSCGHGSDTYPLMRWTVLVVEYYLLIHQLSAIIKDLDSKDGSHFDHNILVDVVI